MKFIREPMSRNFAIINSQTSITKAFCSNPNPTGRCFFNIRPKTSYWVHPTFTTETIESGGRFTAFFADIIARIFSHLKVSPLGVTPLAASTAQGLFADLIISQGAYHG